jgi:hypothetical protein
MAQQGQHVPVYHVMEPEPEDLALVLNPVLLLPPEPLSYLQYMVFYHSHSYHHVFSCRISFPPVPSPLLDPCPPYKISSII